MLGQTSHSVAFLLLLLLLPNANQQVPSAQRFAVPVVVAACNSLFLEHLLQLFLGKNVPLALLVVQSVVE